MGTDNDTVERGVRSTLDRSDIAIAIRSASVRYRVYAERSASVRDVISGRVRSRSARLVQALERVSAEIRFGESVGIIGGNGSGKSTLLSAVAGLVAPTSGEVLVRHQPVLLGVGAALNRDLSGYRNITLGCLAMGLPMSEVSERTVEIAEFTELGEALERPLRTYSSGMRARLAFAIATTQSPEILLIDEALAVGDRRFRAKSLARVREIQAQAGAIMMVTHNMDEVHSSCTRAIWLDNGQVRLDGDPSEVIDRYVNE